MKMKMNKLCLLKLLLFFTLTWTTIIGIKSDWSWKCENKFCRKVRAVERHDPEYVSHFASLEGCKLTCSDYSVLWPKPTGAVNISSSLFKFKHPNNILLVDNEINRDVPAFKLLQDTYYRLQERLYLKNPLLLPNLKSDNRNQKVETLIEINTIIEDVNIVDPVLGTNEEYNLEVLQTKNETTLNIFIFANNFFGARHALETLFQLIVCPDGDYFIPNNVLITDSPKYPYRSLTLDTARNFISVDAIKRNIDALAASKMNRLVWHITDTTSFSFLPESHHEMGFTGAYSLRKIYHRNDIEEIVAYGKVRGVKVTPDFDLPTRAGEGWQNTRFLACFNKQPWGKYCQEPPCGQLDPTKEELYSTLEDIYKEMVEWFDPDVFYVGSSYVHYGCWRSEKNITTWMKNKGWNEEDDQSYRKLWEYFTKKAHSKLDSVSKKNISYVITWNNPENKFSSDVLPANKYIVRDYNFDESDIEALLKKGYRIILNNYHHLNLDCGFGWWVGKGNNWCSPYKEWQRFYSYNLPKSVMGERKDQILGAEANLWSHQVDDTNVDSRIWPRTAALAENLWSDPTTSWKEAETRFLIHRNRLVEEIGVMADTLEPEWCLQNENNCPLYPLHCN